MNRTRIPVLLGAVAVMGATVAGAQERMQGSGIRVTKSEFEVSSTPSTSTTTVEISTGEVSLTTPFDITAYANMTEKNITAHMATGDSLEIQFAELALSKATNQQVRSFANMLLNDHRAHLAKTHEIITDEDVGAQPLAFDPEAMRMRQMLTNLRNMNAGANWDAAFLRFQAASPERDRPAERELQECARRRPRGPHRGFDHVPLQAPRHGALDRDESRVPDLEAGWRVGGLTV